MNADCPNPDRMHALLGEEIEPAERGRLEEHIASCGICQRLLLDFAGSLAIARPTFKGDKPAIGFLERLRALGDNLPIESSTPPTGDKRLGPGRNPEIPGFVIMEEIGRGGMSVVYKARQRWLERIVALKVDYPERVAKAEDFERLLRGLAALTACAHPNVVQAFNVGRHDGLYYGALEYLAGGSLADRLDGRPWEARRAATLVRTLAETVQFIHNRGYVHRDLKPGNILIQTDETSSSEVPKIADFGLAKPLVSGKRLTKEGAILGTPSAMAPEQAAGQTEIGPTADIYGLGGILYELLTGRPPFRGESPFDQLAKVVHEAPQPPSQLTHGISDDLEFICLKCLSKEPASRYESAKDLAADLAAFLEGKPLLSRKTGLFKRVGMWSRRNPVLASLVAIVMASSFALFISGQNAVNRLRLEMQVMRQIAEEQKAISIEAQENLERAIHQDRLGLARRYLDLKDPAAAKEVLEKCRVDLRDEEWQELWKKCQ